MVVYGGLDGVHRGEETKGPCRACKSFKDFTKSMTEQKGASDECPLDKEELGHSTWNFLHTMAAYYPDKPTPKQKKQMCKFFKCILPTFYPCEVCAEDLRKDVEKNPPDVSSALALSTWLCQVHNRVNIKLGKPEFDCSRVMERWKDGWKDGSCD